MNKNSCAIVLILVIALVIGSGCVDAVGKQSIPAPVISPAPSTTVPSTLIPSTTALVTYIPAVQPDAINLTELAFDKTVDIPFTVKIYYEEGKEDVRIPIMQDPEAQIRYYPRHYLIGFNDSEPLHQDFLEQMIIELTVGDVDKEYDYMYGQFKTEDIPSGTTRTQLADPNIGDRSFAFQFLNNAGVKSMDTYLIFTRNNIIEIIRLEHNWPRIGTNTSSVDADSIVKVARAAENLFPTKGARV